MRDTARTPAREDHAQEQEHEWALPNKPGTMNTMCSKHPRPPAAHEPGSRHQTVRVVHGSDDVDRCLLGVQHPIAEQCPQGARGLQLPRPLPSLSEPSSAWLSSADAAGATSARGGIAGALGAAPLAGASTSEASVADGARDAGDAALSSRASAMGGAAAASTGPGPAACSAASGSAGAAGSERRPRSKRTAMTLSVSRFRNLAMTRCRRRLALWTSRRTFLIEAFKARCCSLSVSIVFCRISVRLACTGSAARSGASPPPRSSAVGGARAGRSGALLRLRSDGDGTGSW